MCYKKGSLSNRIHPGPPDATGSRMADPDCSVIQNALRSLGKVWQRRRMPYRWSNGKIRKAQCKPSIRKSLKWSSEKNVYSRKPQHSPSRKRPQCRSGLYIYIYIYIFMCHSRRYLPVESR